MLPSAVTMDSKFNHVIFTNKMEISLECVLLCVQKQIHTYSTNFTLKQAIDVSTVKQCRMLRNYKLNGLLLFYCHHKRQQSEIHRMLRDTISLNKSHRHAVRILMRSAIGICVW